MHWELPPKNPQIAFLFRSWRHERQFGGFQKFKKLPKNWSKKGSLNMFVPMANVLVEGSTFEIRKIDVSKRHLLRAVSTPPYPLPQKQLLSGRRNETKRRTEFGQSNFALSNVRALRAKTLSDLLNCAHSVDPRFGSRILRDFVIPVLVLRAALYFMQKSN